MIKNRGRRAGAVWAGVCLGVFALAACVQAQRQGALPAAFAPGYAIFYRDEGPSVKLAYGAANSDDVGFMMECQKGSKVVDVSDAARAKPSATLTLASEGRRLDLRSVSMESENAPLATARAPVGALPLDGFRRTGRINVAYGDARYDVAANANERLSVKQFFAACQGV